MIRRKILQIIPCGVPTWALYAGYPKGAPPIWQPVDVWALVQDDEEDENHAVYAMLNDGSGMLDFVHEADNFVGTYTERLTQTETEQAVQGHYESQERVLAAIAKRKAALTV